MSVIADHLALIKARIGKATLIAVSKTRSVDEIIEAIKAGQLVFGENRVQKAQSKFPALRARYPNLVLHLIGPLQTNKAQAAVECFDVIQTIDRKEIADAIAKAIGKTGRKKDHKVRLYIQVNIGDEPQKAGVAVDKLAELLGYCRDVCGLEIDGLMCIPPQDLDPQVFFRQMRALADTHHLPHLSMGMSDDFETAIACGATEIRIGTAIFGARPLVKTGAA